LTRVLYGGQTALRIAGLVLLVTVSIGVLVGSIAGYYGGRIDSAINIVLNTVLALPDLSLTIALVAVLGPGETSLLLALIATTWAGYARLFRGAVLATRNQLFVEAAHAYGASHSRVLFRHVLPNVARPIFALASTQFAGAVLALAGLSFLGLGVQPPTPDWGTMLSDARPYLRSSPHLAVAPALAVVCVSLGATLFADALLAGSIQDSR
jgi:peptide/nickel transport system permease protein